MGSVKISVGFEVVCVVGPDDQPFPVETIEAEIAKSRTRQASRRDAPNSARGSAKPVGILHVKGDVSPEQFEEFKRTYASALRSQPIELGDQSQLLSALRFAIYDVPRGGASGDAPAWLVKLHRAACDVVGVVYVDNGDGVEPTPSPQMQPGSHAGGMYAAEGMNQAVTARLVGALESIAKSLKLEAPALPDLVHAVATLATEKAELRAWHDRTLPQLEAALARIAELETGALIESRAAASPALVAFKKQFDEKMRSEEEAAGVVVSADQVAELYTAIVDQPPPVAQPDRIPVWENVISDFRRRFADDFDGIVEDDVQKYAGDHVLADMRERDRIGRERYGTPLTTGNGRDHVVDAYQELLDAAVYLRAAWLEGAQVGSAYFSSLDMVMSIRMLLDSRGVSK